MEKEKYNCLIPYIKSLQLDLANVQHVIDFFTKENKKDDLEKEHLQEKKDLIFKIYMEYEKEYIEIKNCLINNGFIFGYDELDISNKKERLVILRNWVNGVEGYEKEKRQKTVNDIIILLDNFYYMKDKLYKL